MQHTQYVAQVCQDGSKQISDRQGRGALLLSPRHDLGYYSGNFGWGKDDILGGLQTAQAILADALWDDRLVGVWLCDFWRAFVHKAPPEGFAVSADQVGAWIVDEMTRHLMGLGMKRKGETADG